MVNFAALRDDEADAALSESREDGETLGYEVWASFFSAFCLPADVSASGGSALRPSARIPHMKRSLSQEALDLVGTGRFQWAMLAIVGFGNAADAVRERQLAAPKRLSPRAYLMISHIPGGPTGRAARRLLRAPRHWREQPGLPPPDGAPDGVPHQCNFLGRPRWESPLGGRERRPRAQEGYRRRNGICGWLWPPLRLLHLLRLSANPAPVCWHWRRWVQSGHFLLPGALPAHRRRRAPWRGKKKNSLAA